MRLWEKAVAGLFVGSFLLSVLVLPSRAQGGSQTSSLQAATNAPSSPAPEPEDELVRVEGRLTSVITRLDSVTLAIRTKEGSVVFVQTSDRPPQARVGNWLILVAREPKGSTSLSSLELVRIEERRVQVRPEIASAAPPPPTPMQEQPPTEPISRGVFINLNAPPPSTTLKAVLDTSATTLTGGRGTLPSRGGVTPAQRAQALHKGQKKSAPSTPNPLASAPLSQSLEVEIERLKGAYKSAVLFFNRRLTDAQAEIITQALLYYSLLYGVDPRFVVAVIATESGFRPDAVGSKGEMGLGQLMPGTAQGLGVVNPFDPVQNIEGCVRLLRRHLDNYAYLPVDKQVSYTLAAYNAGANAVAKYGGVPPYPITKRYIQKVLALYRQLTGTAK